MLRCVLLYARRRHPAPPVRPCCSFTLERDTYQLRGRKVEQQHHQHSIFSWKVKVVIKSKKQKKVQLIIIRGTLSDGKRNNNTGDHSKYQVPGRTYGTHKNIHPCLLLLMTIFGPIYYLVWSPVMLFLILIVLVLVVVLVV